MAHDKRWKVVKKGDNTPKQQLSPYARVLERQKKGVSTRRWDDMSLHVAAAE
jgi:hypothetical protein